jgi:hypothetical protein
VLAREPGGSIQSAASPHPLPLAIVKLRPQSHQARHKSLTLCLLNPWVSLQSVSGPQLMAEWHLRGDGELKTVLITGGAGFIGSVPVRLLVQKTDARGLVKTVPSWAPSS